MEKTVVMDLQTHPGKLYVACDGQVQTYSAKGQLILGRGVTTQPVDIACPWGFVSRHHGVFYADASGYSCSYMDVGSANGTHFNGVKLQPGEQQLLRDGDVLQIMGKLVNGVRQIVTVVFAQDYPLQSQWESCGNLEQVAEINIGRAFGGLSAWDNRVSKHHASFCITQQGWMVTDFNSTNGVFVNGSRVYGQQLLHTGDCIRITNVHFMFTGGTFVYQKTANGGHYEPTGHAISIAQPTAASQPTNGPALSIQILERSVWQRTKKLMLLQNINMTIQATEMVLILGGSGAGKTTFMNAVMGYEKAEGKILHGETDIYEDFESIKYKIGFVPQLDLVRGNDTVYDTLSNAAEMKLSSSIKKAQRIERIEKVLATLGLQRERNSLVSKLSGGQRKRLSIAVEYIADPSLFFLDEPDSGLDGIMASTLMHNLRTIADEGKIVMVISHAPDRVAELFDKIIVLAKSTRDNCGHLAFFGSGEQAKTFFDTATLEGVVKRINRPDEGGDGLSDHYIDKYNNWVQGGCL